VEGSRQQDKEAEAQKHLSTDSASCAENSAMSYSWFFFLASCSGITKRTQMLA